MFSYISEGEPGEYGFLPAGIYEGKIVKMEEGISQGAKTRGCPQLDEIAEALETNVQMKGIKIAVICG